MTVGSNVKNCYFALKSAEASLRILQEKTVNEQSKVIFKQAEQSITEVKTDLHKQVLFLAREEPQYK